MITLKATPLFSFDSSDITSTAIIDTLSPKYPLTKNGLFLRNGTIGKVYVTHSKKGMFAVIKIGQTTHHLTGTEEVILQVFYTQDKG